MSIFDVNEDDLQQLGDCDLRTLIGLLCEADYRKEGLSTRGILWGGHQNAPDGGVDVAINTTVSPRSSDFVPLPNVVYQVKKSKMDASNIKREMCPKGRLRPAICELINKQGAYIIVSAGSSITGKQALPELIKAMEEAIVGTPGHESLELDFYDRGRIASWVRSHPSMILWVHEKVGKSKLGWKPYGNWTKVPDEMPDKYIMDDKSRLCDRKDASAEDISVEQGIERLREILSKPGSSVRLVGLSGVGKTRLVQALFDEKIGKASSLNQDQVCYTDNETVPSPSSDHFIEQLIAHDYRGIVVIDNCSSEEHARLAEACDDTKVSLITIEHDMRDDVPEQTEGVFELKGASNDLVERLTRERFTHISLIDANTIAKFSEGNARIALAIAETMGLGTSLAKFKSKNLFERLFYQEKTFDNSLFLSAQLLSLVYSFNVKSIDEGSHLQVLGRLGQREPNQMYGAVDKLMKQGLIQARSNWRAILPQALANWLASSALDAMHNKTLIDTFLNHNEPHLTKSFLRRLGYLHESETAIELLPHIFAEDGPIFIALEENRDFESFQLIKNISPLCPCKALEFVESSLSQLLISSRIDCCDILAEVLRKIAYEEKYFVRCADILVTLTLQKDDVPGFNSIEIELEQLFYVRGSGTHASLEVRLDFVFRLLAGTAPSEREIGLKLLSCMLTRTNIRVADSYDFGARQRDYGYSPQGDKLVEWYRIILYRVQVLLKDEHSAIYWSLRKIVADSVKDIWVISEVRGAIFECSETINNTLKWFECWAEIHRIKTFHSTEFDSEALSILGKLEALSKPISNIDNCYAFFNYPAIIFSHLKRSNASRSVENTCDHEKFMREQAFNIGVVIAQNLNDFERISFLTVTKCNYWTFQFGMGLATVKENIEDIWACLKCKYLEADISLRKEDVIRGYLSSISTVDNELFKSIVEDISKSSELASKIYNFLSSSIVTTELLDILMASLERFLPDFSACIDLGKMKVYESKESLDRYLCFVESLIDKPTGAEAAIRIIQSSILSKNPISFYLKSSGLKALAKYKFNAKWENYSSLPVLDKVFKFCFEESTEIEVLKNICQNFAEQSRGRPDLISIYSQLLKVLAVKIPAVFLCYFYEKWVVNQKEVRSTHDFWGYDARLAVILNAIPDEVIITWCKKSPKQRFKLISISFNFAYYQKEVGFYVWGELFDKMISEAPRLENILNNIRENLSAPKGAFCGELSEYYEQRLPLYKQLVNHRNEIVCDWAKQWYEHDDAYINELKLSYKANEAGLISFE